MRLSEEPTEVADGVWTSGRSACPLDMLVPGRGTKVARPIVWGFVP
jgi:hypothetical protein